MKKKLLSLGQLNSSGCKTHVQYEILKIVKCTFMMKKAKNIYANLYMLKEGTQQEDCVGKIGRIINDDTAP